MAYDLAVIGASWGGIEAVSTVISAWPAGMRGAVVIVLHRPIGGPGVLIPRNRVPANVTVREPHDKDLVDPGGVFLAPAGYHLLVDGDQFSLSVDEQVRYSRPSIDVLFESAADSRAERLIGIVLTGANRDGADGLARIHTLGGLCVVQTPSLAACPLMPQAALEAVPSAQVMSVGDIAAMLPELLGPSCSKSSRNVPA